MIDRLPPQILHGGSPGDGGRTGVYLGDSSGAPDEKFPIGNIANGKFEAVSELVGADVEDGISEGMINGVVKILVGTDDGLEAIDGLRETPDGNFVPVTFWVNNGF